MRKLILIGNGFDLAHGMKTRYGDFFEGYLKSIIGKNNPYSNRLRYDDGLIKYDNPRRLYPPIDPVQYREEWFKDLKRRISKCLDDPNLRFEEEEIRVSISRGIFSRLLRKNHLRWVDIESEYFNMIYENIDNQAVLQKINADFKIIREKLIDYLKTEEEKINEKDNIPSPEILDLMHKDKPEDLFFVNFNYTNLAEKYVDEHEEIIYIHGNLDESKGKVIFGMGDEHHKQYLDHIDSPNLVDALYYSKSAWYLKNDNYKRLNGFINKIRGNYPDPFKVEIYGHSCGLSDRTLLKQIFNHPNCQSIKIIHYENEENYTKQTIEILRHFDDPLEFRKKLVPFHPDNAMPQYGRG